VQLIDAQNGSHLWAERFDKPVAELFDMQDEVVARLANASRSKAWTSVDGYQTCRLTVVNPAIRAEIIGRREDCDAKRSSVPERLADYERWLDRRRDHRDL
jgi:hypothetical protein